MQLRNVRLQKRIDERFHQRGQKFTHILRPSLSLSGLAKVKKCGVEFRTSPREDEDHAFCSFFSNVEKWIKWRNSSKQTEGRTHAHTSEKRERERDTERERDAVVVKLFSPLRESASSSSSSSQKAEKHRC